MRIKLFFFLTFGFGVLFSCTKDKVPTPPISPEKPWEKFVGHYKVYDTLGNYLYNSEIEYFTKINSSGFNTDNIRILNLMNKMDYEFIFIPDTNPNILDLKVNDSIIDKNENHWFICSLYDDTLTTIHENCLINGRITLYFEITNIKYWMNEAVPYVDENVKHVYVKQP